ncbi:MAG: aquaporin [Limisphaerales bacterium]
MDVFRFRNLSLISSFKFWAASRARRCVVSDCQRPSRIFPGRRVCLQRVWRTFTRPLFAQAAFVAEFVLTFFFLLIILGSTDKRAPQGLAPIAIGFGLTLIHLIGIPVTNLSVNPARSTGPAVFVGGWAIQQLWLFWVAPILGAIFAGIIYPLIAGKPVKESGKLIG